MNHQNALVEHRKSTLSPWMRQLHRWLSILFTATVVANFVAMAMNAGKQPPPFITYSPLLPLFLLMATGLYLFALPYAVRWRAARRTA